MILFARNETYRPKQLSALLERHRDLFENWTHDAAIIPSRFFPYWRVRFERERERLRDRWRSWRREGFEELFDDTLSHIRENGPVMRKILLRGAIAIVLLVVVVLVGGYLWLRSSLPTLDGEVRASGLTAPVEVVRDRHAIPHIYADSFEDAAFAMGFVHAAHLRTERQYAGSMV